MSVNPTSNCRTSVTNIGGESQSSDDSFNDKTTKESKKGRVYKLFKEFCGGTSLHGLGQLVANRSGFIKFVWVVAFVAAVAGNAYHLSNLIESYLDYPKQQVTTADDNPIPFPGVTICNLDAFSKSNLEVISALPTSNLYQLNERVSAMITLGILTEDEAKEYQSPMTMLENVGSEEARQIGHRLEDLVLRCTFLGRPCNISAEFTHFINSLMFNCYTFNPGIKGQNFNSVGQEYGLSLILYLEATNGTRVNAPYNYHTGITNSIGARVTIHPQGVTPLPHYSGIDVMPGHSTSISYKPQIIGRLGEPYGTCWGDETTYQADSSYNALVCLGECRQQVTMETCKCKASYEPAVNDSKYIKYPYCLKLPAGNNTEALEIRNSHVTCSGDARLEFADNVTMRSDCGCTPRCYDYRYPCSVSESKWPAAQYYDSFLQFELQSRPDRMQLKAYTQLQPVCILACVSL